MATSKAYVSLFTEHHIAQLSDWLKETGELFIDLEYPHSGGSGNNYFIYNLPSLKELITKQTHPEIEITIFRPIIFPFRGNDYSVVQERALKEIPNNLYYQIAAIKPYPDTYRQLADGIGHAQMRSDFASLEPGETIGVGIHPFDNSTDEFREFYKAYGSFDRIGFTVRKTMNSYKGYIDNPDNYKGIIAQWFTK